MDLDIHEIEKILPQRYPFLMIDRITELEPKKKAVALKNVSFNEGFFAGHFPGNPVMPGVLIVEAMAQASIVFFAESYPEQAKAGLIYYLGKVQAKFTHPVFPGDQLRIEVTPVKIISRMAIVEAKAYVKDNLVTHAELAFAAKESSSK